MNIETQHNSLLKIFIFLSIFSTAIHNLDNYLRFELYPQPAWITPGGIFRSWVLWTSLGIAGYLLYKNQRFWPSYVCLIIYSTCGLSSLAHYLYGSMEEFSFLMHAFILTDALAGFMILGFTLWSSLFLQKHLRTVPTKA